MGVSRCHLHGDEYGSPRTVAAERPRAQAIRPGRILALTVNSPSGIPAVSILRCGLWMISPGAFRCSARQKGTNEMRLTRVPVTDGPWERVPENALPADLAEFRSLTVDML
jgi:hypothetical protein